MKQLLKSVFFLYIYTVCSPKKNTEKDGVELL